MTIKTKASKPQVYFIPGTMCDQALWQYVFPQVSTFCQPLHCPIPNGLGFDALVDDFIARLPDEKVRIVGFSLGGYLASYIAVTHPERIAQLCVVANSPCPLNTTELAQRQTLVDWTMQHGYAGMSRKRAAQYLDNTQQNKSVDNNSLSYREHVIDVILGMDKAMTEATFISQMKHTSTRTDLYQHLSVFNVPTLFVASKDDPMVNQSWLSSLTAENEHITAITLPGSGHMLPLEQPKLLAQVLQSWL